MKRRSVRAAVAIAALSFCAVPASAMTIKEFRKFTTDEQSTYIGAAVSMLAYTYAASGEREKGKCIQNWYYGKPGTPTPGPRAITVELAVAEDDDADRYHVEGVILGVTDKACDVPAAQPPAK